MEESSVPNLPAEPTSNCHDCLFSAVKRGDEEAVRALLENCGDIGAVDESGWTVLHHACGNGQSRIVELLLDNGASVHTVGAVTGGTALHIAAQLDCKDTAELLLRRGADVCALDEDGRTALHNTAFRDNESMVKLLLSYGAYIEALDYDGRTPLSYACIKGNSKVANVLIKSRASINLLYTGSVLLNGFCTLLHFAASNDMTDTIQLLLDLKPVNVDVLDVIGRTPLHVACNILQLNAAKCLLDNGACVSYPCETDGSTALHFAAHGSGLGFSSQNEDLALVKLLFKYKADVNAENKKGQTPFGCALDTDTIIPSTGIIQIQEFFLKQLLKMIEQKLFISENNLKEVSENVKIMSFRASCRDEIERMKKSMIGNSHVRFYDILTKGINHLAYYMYNEEVELVLESENYKAEFPIYASEIHEMFLQGKERRDLLSRSSDVLFTIINEFYELPRILVERISGYLTNVELASH